MTPRSVARVRSRNLGLDGPPFTRAAEVVAWHGAVQSQEYVPAQWSLAQRVRGLAPGDVDAAVAEGTILRTHALRPTWHFLAREDARLVLEVTGPRVQRANASRYAHLGLDARTLGRARRAIAKELESGEHLTRTELGERLVKRRIDVSGQRLPHMLMHCELELAICSGARKGRDHTYAAFDERVPAAKPVDPSDGTRVLVERYLRSHGPASVADVSWWATLKAADVRRALDELGAEVHGRTADGLELWWMGARPGPRSKPAVRLLETFDEYVVGYTRSRFTGDPHAESALAGWRGRSSLRNVATRNGAILGMWRRSKTATTVSVEVGTYEEPSRAHLHALRREVARLGRFYGVDPTLDVGRIRG